MIKLKESGKLIGDVNLFFQDDGSVEINIMISGIQLEVDLFIYLLAFRFWISWKRNSKRSFRFTFKLY